MKHYIDMTPREIRFVDEKGNDIEGDDGLMNWKKFFGKVEDHPKWGTTYKLIRCMSDIWEAFKEASEIRKDWILELDDEPYNELKGVCENPKYTFIDRLQGPREMQGWGVGNRYAVQMLCFSRQVMNATDEDPRKKEEETVEEKAEGKAEEKADKAGKKQGKEKAA